MRYAVILVALATTACGDVEVRPLTGPTIQLRQGLPARIELTATPGTGATGLTVAVSARVQDAYGATVPSVDVTFTASVGTFSVTPVSTNGDGVARTTLTAPAGSAEIHAAAGSATAPMAVVTVQPFVAPPPTPPTTPPNVPPPGSEPTGPLTVSVSVGPTTLGTQSVFAAGVMGAAPESLAWTFGDGATFTGSSPTTAHTYTAIGSYAASVTVRDAFGRSAHATATAVVTPVPPPPPPPPGPPPGPPPAYAVTLSASPTSVQTGTATTLTATATPLNGAPPATVFEFACGGNGSLGQTSPSSLVATCTYATPGTFAAHVSAGDGGSTASSASTPITVTAPPPSSVALNCSTGTHAQTLSTCVATATVNGQPTTQITSIVWNFGDSTGDQPFPGNVGSHTYQSANTFTVVARATLAGGETVTGTTTTTILP